MIELDTSVERNGATPKKGAILFNGHMGGADKAEADIIRLVVVHAQWAYYYGGAHRYAARLWGLPPAVLPL